VIWNGGCQQIATLGGRSTLKHVSRCLLDLDKLHRLTVLPRLVFFGAFPLVFQNNHGFTVSQTGLSFLGLFVGMLAGITSDLFWRRRYDRLVKRSEAQGGGSEPEFRLPATIFGAWLVPLSLFGKLSHPLGSRHRIDVDAMQGLGGPRMLR
jgi:hypothetical protein